jgi:hypothetical protein
MGTVSRDAGRDDLIDEYFTYLRAEWEAVSTLAKEWAGWSDADRLDFALGWSIREDRLAQLQVLDDEGRLSPAQQVKYGRLLELVVLNYPLLDPLFRATGLPVPVLGGALRGA